MGCHRFCHGRRRKWRRRSDATCALGFLRCFFRRQRKMRNPAECWCWHDRRADRRSWTRFRRHCGGGHSWVAVTRLRRRSRRTWWFVLFAGILRCLSDGRRCNRATVRRRAKYGSCSPGLAAFGYWAGRCAGCRRISLGGERFIRCGGFFLESVAFFSGQRHRLCRGNHW